MPESKVSDSNQTKESPPKKQHLCPNCKEIWDCNYDDICKAPYEMLDLKCDDDEVRAKLDGDWLN